MSSLRKSAGVAALMALALPLPLPAALAGGGGAGAHGGSVLVCHEKPGPSGPITSIEALDLWEAKKAIGFGSPRAPKLLAPDAGETPQAYARRVIVRMLEKYSPEGMKTLGSPPPLNPPDWGTRQGLAEALQALQLDQAVQETYGIVPIEDLSLRGNFDRKRCQVVQMMAQKTIAGRTRLFFDPKLYDHPLVDNWTRGVILLHEYVYYLARMVAQRDALRTRMLTGLLIRQEFPGDFRTRYQNLGFGTLR
jgi:hypothetical protein